MGVHLVFYQKHSIHDFLVYGSKGGLEYVFGMPASIPIADFSNIELIGLNSELRLINDSIKAILIPKIQLGIYRPTSMQVLRDNLALLPPQAPRF